MVRVGKNRGEKGARGGRLLCINSMVRKNAYFSFERGLECCVLGVRCRE